MFYIRWRVGFYVAGEEGCVGNFMELFDEFLVWKTKSIDAKSVEVCFLNHVLWCDQVYIIS